MIIWQEKAIFVDFKKMTLWSNKNPISDAKQKIFSRFNEGWFLSRSLRFMYFLSTLHIQEMFIRIQGNFRYNLSGPYDTYKWLYGRRKGFLSILRNDTPLTLESVHRLARNGIFRKKFLTSGQCGWLNIQATIAI